MMENINFRDFYSKVLRLFRFGDYETSFITHLMVDSDKAVDYEDFLKHDRFFTKIICQTASANMKASVVSSLSHGVVVVGQDKVRNFVLGHSIRRLFSLSADEEFKSLDESEKIIKYAILASEHARKCKSEYLGVAFVAGFIFDIFAHWISLDAKRAEKLTPLFDQVWKHSLQTATWAWFLGTHDRVVITYRRVIFAIGLLHEIGRLALAFYNEDVYLKCVEKIQAARETNIFDDIYEIGFEKEFFDLSHPELGSAILFQTSFLRELEMEVDFHHDPSVLRARNADAFIAVAILNIADRLSWLTSLKSNFNGTEFSEVIKGHEAYFPLKSQEIFNLLGSIRGRGLLSA